MSFRTANQVVKEEWTTSSITSVFRLRRSPALESFSSPVIDKCGLEWQFSFKRGKTMRQPELGTGRSVRSAFFFSSQWLCKDPSLAQAMVDIVVRLEPFTDASGPSISKRINLDPHSRVAFEIGKWTASEIEEATTLSATVTILEGPSEQNSITLPLPSAVSASLTDSQAATPIDFDALTTQPAVLETLSQSLNSGAFFDTKFIACSRRETSDNRLADATQVVYAQTDVLEAVSPNLDLGEMSAREDRLFLFLGAGCTPREWYHQMSEIVTQYEYESDSDLDEGEDRNTDLVEPAETIPPPPAEVVFEAVVEGHGASSGYEDSSHSASGEAMVSEEDTSIVSAPTTSDFEDVVGSEGYARPDVQADRRYNALPVPIEPPTNITHVIYVKDTACKTWRALIYYCYTGRVAFLPLKSCHNAVARLPSGGRDNRCSPKSMYCLAHKLGITALETSALAAIEEHLSKNNILDEIFSKYTSKYPVIRETEMRILMENRREPEVVQALPRMIQKISQGKMPHAETVLSDVMQKLFQD